MFPKVDAKKVYHHDVCVKRGHCNLTAGKFKHEWLSLKASVMVGKREGLPAKLKRGCPHMINIHCVCHKLALIAWMQIRS